MRTTEIICYGHDNIRGTHPKSIEITASDKLSPRGTCIIGVKMECSHAELDRIRGPIHITLACGDCSDTLTAQANPGYSAIESLIIRTGNFRCRKTFAFGASKGASELDPGLLELMRREDSRLRLIIKELPEQPGLARRGLLVIVPTPIGNDRDLTPRSLEEIRKADLIAAEDTRTARKLLSRFKIHVPLMSYHDHNERKREGVLLKFLREGYRVVLISEAGTPTISDPGFIIVRAAIAAGFSVIGLPGPCAALVALSASGIPPDRFLFLGFSPRTKIKRLEFLHSVANLPYTLILYEAPHRIVPFLADALLALGDRSVCLGRELTKPYEEYLRGSLSTVAGTLVAEGKLRGEFTVVIEGAPLTAERNTENLHSLIMEELRIGKSVRQIRDELILKVGGSKRDLYEQIITCKNQMSD